LRSNELTLSHEEAAYTIESYEASFNNKLQLLTVTCGSCTLKSQSFLAREIIGLKNCKMSTGLKPVKAKCNSHSYKQPLGGHSLSIIAHCIVRARRHKLTRMHTEFMEHIVELPPQEITQKFCNILYQKKPTKKLFP